jgi:glycosyltransferase involved in cell wall biosynthesis
MKILLITDGVFPFVVGGMQKHSHYLAKFLSLRGNKVTLVHCVAHGTTVPERKDVLTELGLPESNDLEVLGFHFPRPGIVPGHYLKESYNYSKIIYDSLCERLSEFDFIYAKGFAAWHILHEKSRGKKMPPVGVKFHGYEMYQPPASFKSRLEHWMLRGPVKWNNRAADFVFSYGGKITDIIEHQLKIERKRIIEIPTGIESVWCTENIPLKAVDIKTFLFIGRFERRKGIQELNEALKLLSDRKDLRFQFIGPIPQGDKVAAHNITYHGSITDKKEIQKIMDQCQVLVVPSHSEGMPNVIMEGMARGLAILATDVGAVNTIVDDKNGWLIAPGSAGAIKSALEAVLAENPEKTFQKQLASIQRIKDFFTWESVSARVEDEIRKRL